MTPHYAPGQRPPPPRPITLPLVVAALVVPAALAWVVHPALGIFVTGLAAVALVVAATR